MSSAASHLGFFPHCFLKHQNHLSFHMHKSMLAHRLPRDVQSVCVAGSPKVWFSSHSPPHRSFCSSPNFYFWMFLWKLEGLGVRGLMITGSSLSNPHVCGWTSKTPLTGLFTEKTWPGLASCLGILSLSPVIFQGPFVGPSCWHTNSVGRLSLCPKRPFPAMLTLRKVHQMTGPGLSANMCRHMSPVPT